MLAVIDGLADTYIYPRDGTKRWDTCAPEALIRSLDGTMTDIFGNDYCYMRSASTPVDNYYGLVASLDLAYHPTYIEQLSDELKQQVKADARKQYGLE